MQDGNKKSYVVYNDGNYLVMKYIDVKVDDYGDITASITDSDIPGNSIEYQLINIFIPDDAITVDVDDDSVN